MCMCVMLIELYYKDGIEILSGDSDGNFTVKDDKGGMFWCY